jgi:beta-galactosidase
MKRLFEVIIFTGMSILHRCLLAGITLILMLTSTSCTTQAPVRQRICFNADWRFAKDDPNGVADKLKYDNIRDWVMVTGAEFTNDPNFANKKLPEGNPGSDVVYTQPEFDEKGWRPVMLPHDWAIGGPFDPKAPGGTGKLPFDGVGWYRRHFTVPISDQGRQIYLEIDGAMSYANVWLNGRYVGGWPFGYASWQVDLTPYVNFGGDNVLAIRLDNPPKSSRWYPGGGIYRNVWLTKTQSVHVGQWGTFITTRDISRTSATIDLKVTIDNDSKADAAIEVSTDVFILDAESNKTGDAVVSFKTLKATIAAGANTTVKGSVILENPRLWGPPPTQTPHRYVAVTNLWQSGKLIDKYETRFGIRSLRFEPESGIYVNDELIKIKGVDQHHDLGALGAAFNIRAAERHLEILREMGCNAIRTAHNPPAPEFLELADKMGFLVMDEAFDVWVRQKTPMDFHLIFPDWHEQDLRAMVRRDRNHPSIIIWSIGNEVGEQYTGEEGAALAKELSDIVRQ